MFSTYTPLAVYPGNGVQTDFAAPDMFYDENDIRAVMVIDQQETPQIKGTHFNVVVLGREQTPPFRQMGLLRFIVPPPAGANVVPFILPSLVQDQGFEGKPVTPRQHERVHDRHVQTIAMLYEFFNRGYRSPLDTPAALRFIVAGREGYVPTWDMDGNLIEGPTVGQVATVAEFIDNINTVAGMETEVNIVAAIDDQIIALYAIRAQIEALGPVANQIAILAPLDDELIALAPRATQIGQLGPYALEIGQLAPYRLNIETVANNIANVNIVANNIADVNNAYANAMLAKDYATKAVDVPVQPGLFSAFHWATKAQQYASTVNLPASPAALDYLRRNAANTAWENRTPAQTRADLGAAALSGANFTGAVDFAAGWSVGASYSGYLTGGNALLLLDTNDYWLYNRASNLLQFYHGGVLTFQVAATGAISTGQVGDLKTYIDSGDRPVWLGIGAYTVAKKLTAGVLSYNTVHAGSDLDICVFGGQYNIGGTAGSWRVMSSSGTNTEPCLLMRIA